MCRPKSAPPRSADACNKDESSRVLTLLHNRDNGSACASQAVDVSRLRARGSGPTRTLRTRGDPTSRCLYFFRATLAAVRCPQFTGLGMNARLIALEWGCTSGLCVLPGRGGRGGTWAKSSSAWRSRPMTCPSTLAPMTRMPPVSSVRSLRRLRARASAPTGTIVVVS